MATSFLTLRSSDGFYYKVSIEASGASTVLAVNQSSIAGPGPDYQLLKSSDGNYYKLQLNTTAGVTAYEVGQVSVPNEPQVYDPLVVINGQVLLQSTDSNWYWVKLITSSGVTFIDVDQASTPFPYTGSVKGLASVTGTFSLPSMQGVAAGQATATAFMTGTWRIFGSVQGHATLGSGNRYDWLTLKSNNGNSYRVRMETSSGVTYLAVDQTPVIETPRDYLRLGATNGSWYPLTIVTTGGITDIDIGQTAVPEEPQIYLPNIVMSGKLLLQSTDGLYHWFILSANSGVISYEIDQVGIQPPFTGAVAGTASASLTQGSTVKSLVGTSSGHATVTGAAKAIFSISGQTASGHATVSAAMRRFVGVAGSVSGHGSASATAKRLVGLAGSTIGHTDISGGFNLPGTPQLSGTVSGHATVAGTFGGLIVGLFGKSSGSSTWSGTAVYIPGLRSAVVGTATVTGILGPVIHVEGNTSGNTAVVVTDLSITRRVSGSVSSQALTLAFINYSAGVNGISRGDSDFQANLTYLVDLVGSSLGSALLNARMVFQGAYDGIAAGQGTLTGTARRFVGLAGTSSGSATVSSSVGRNVTLRGTIFGNTPAVTANLRRFAGLSGSISGHATVTGFAVRIAYLAGSSAGLTTVTLDLRRRVNLFGDVAGISSFTATKLDNARFLDGISAGTGDVTGDLIGTFVLKGKVSAGAIASRAVLNYLAVFTAQASGIGVLRADDLFDQVVFGLIPLNKLALAVQSGTFVFLMRDLRENVDDTAYCGDTAAELDEIIRVFQRHAPSAKWRLQIGESQPNCNFQDLLNFRGLYLQKFGPEQHVDALTQLIKL
jgi:hypothetical protein